MSEFNSINYENCATSSASADAIQRAWQSATKLDSGATATGTKRPLEDVQSAKSMEIEISGEKESMEIEISGEKESMEIEVSGEKDIVQQLATIQMQRSAGGITVEEWELRDKTVKQIISSWDQQLRSLQVESDCKAQMSGGDCHSERISTLPGTQQCVELDFHSRIFGGIKATEEELSEKLAQEEESYSDCEIVSFVPAPTERHDFNIRITDVREEESSSDCEIVSFVPAPTERHDFNTRITDVRGHTDFFIPESVNQLLKDLPPPSSMNGVFVDVDEVIKNIENWNPETEPNMTKEEIQDKE